jgi:hypothetical protein
MKIAIFTITRTRSSFLLDALCQHYGLKNHFEYYNNTYSGNTFNSFYKIRSKTIFEHFTSTKKQETADLFTWPSFGVKIFPHNFVSFIREKSSFRPDNKSYPLFVKEHILDLNEYFNLNQYDKIFLLNRKEIVDNIISQLYALQIGTFLLEQKDKSRLDRLKPKGELYLTTNDMYVYRSRIYCHLFLKQLPKYFDNLNIKYEELDYDEVPFYIEKNYPSIKSQFIDTEFDYKNGITNYNEIKKEIETLYDECLNSTDWSRVFD